MPFIADRIFRGGAATTFWPIQVIQDALSLHANLPLRIWSTELAEERGKHKDLSEKLSELQKTLSSKDRLKFFSKVSDDFVEYFGFRSGSGWLTRPSNPHPAIAYLRDSPVWRAWEQVLLRNLTTASNEDQTEKCFTTVHGYFGQELKLALYPFEVNSVTKYLVVGPVIVAKPERMKNLTLSDLVKPFCEGISKIASTLKQNDGNIRRLSEDRNQEELAMLLTSTGWVTDQCFEMATDRLGKTITAILRVKCALAKDDIISNTAYNNIAQIVYMLHPNAFLSEKPALTQVHFKEDVHHYFMVGLPKTDDSPDKARNHVMRAILNGQRCKRWDLVLEKYDHPESKVWVKLPDSVKNSRTKELDLDKYEDGLKSMRGDLGLNFANRFHSHISNRLVEFSRWLNDEFGILSTDWSEPGAQIYNKMAQKICALFTADAVMLYLHKFENDSTDSSFDDKKLVQIGAFKNNDFPETGKWSKRQQKHMDQIAKLSKSDREKESICYRSVSDSGSAHFCKACYVETLSVSGKKQKKVICDPLEEAIPSPELDKKFPGKSVMALPLALYDRPMGVLEIKGFHPYQFRNGMFQLARRVAELMSPFIYEDEVLSKLLKLAHFMLDPTNNEENRYREVCKTMAEIFLADGAILFVPNSQDFSRFDLVAHYKINYLAEKRTNQELSESLVGQRWFDQDQNLAFSYSIAEQVENDPNWPATRSHRAAIHKQFPEGMGLVVRVSDASNLLPLCRFSLYYYKQALTPNWLPTIKFVSHYLLMLIMARQTDGPLSYELNEKEITEVFKQEGAWKSLGRIRRRFDQFLRSDFVLKNEDYTNRALNNLRDAYKKKDLVLVLGAGVSAGHELPDWDKLLKELLVRALTSPDEPDHVRRLLSDMFVALLPKDPLISASYIMRRFEAKKRSLQSQIQDIFSQSIKKDPDENLVQAIRNLCFSEEGAPLVDSIITYNYDDVIEEFFGRERRKLVPFWHDKGELKIGELPIYHVHGYLPRKDRWPVQGEEAKIVLAAEHYAELFNNAWSWNNVVQMTKFCEKTCVFIGFSFADPNVRRLMHSLSWNSKFPNRRHYIIFAREQWDSMKRRVLESLMRAGVFSSGKASKGQDLSSELPQLNDRVQKMWECSQDDDLGHLGVDTIRVEKYKDIPAFLNKIKET